MSVDWFFLSHRLPLARALRERGWDVTVAAQDTGLGETIRAHDLRFVPLPLDRGSRHPAREARVVASFVDLYRRTRPDIVHHVSPKPILYGSVAARVARVPRVVNAVSGLGWAFTDRQGATFGSRVLRAGLGAGYRFAFSGSRTRVVFQNPDDLAELSAAALLDDRRVRIIRGSGVDVHRFTPTPLPAGSPRVVLPARLLGDKGAREFLEAAARLRGEGVVAQFVLAGRADPQNPAGIPLNEVDRWVASGVVEWLGHVEHADMPALLQSATLVVLPSYREGMPLVLAEAAACGRAVVATDVPGCREIVVPGQTGWLVPARDCVALAAAIRDALSDRERLRTYGAAARARVEQEFSLDSVVRQTLEIYDELLAS